MSDVIIVGGGVSGLASAYYLSKKGIKSKLIEAQPRLGGLIQTDQLHGCQLEAGPDSYIATKPAVSELAAEIPELANEIIGTNDQARRIFIVRDGALVPLPAGMVMMAPGNLRAAIESPLFSDCTKTRIVEERHFKPLERGRDITIAEFVLDHFNSEILEYVAEPLLMGVYGGDAGRLSARSVLPRFLEYERRFGSLVRAVRSERKTQAAKPASSMFLSFRRGMQSLTDALERASAASVTAVHGEATALEHDGKKWRVHIGNSVEECHHVMLCLPAHRAARLLGDPRPQLADELAGIPYSSAITVMLVFDKAEIQHPLDGFGFLVPCGERRGIAAATWINTKFPPRIPSQYVALRAFIVDRDAESILQEHDDGIVNLVRSEFARLMGIETRPLFHTVHRLPLSMPQYIVGHEARYSKIRELLAADPSLSLVGNAYEGVGIPDCVRLARSAAARIEP